MVAVVLLSAEDGPVVNAGLVPTESCTGVPFDHYGTQTDEQP